MPWFIEFGFLRCLEKLNFDDTFPFVILGCLSLKEGFSFLFGRVFVVRVFSTKKNVKNSDSGSLAMLDQLIAGC